MAAKQITEDAFNLLCGAQIGSGCFREVFECRIRKDLVVKVEKANSWRAFHNVMEQKFWEDHEYDKISRWLAPCEYMSPDGRILLQKKCEPLRELDLPTQLPRFLTDLKKENFGILEGRVVCVDYALTVLNPSTRMRKVNWD